MLDTKLDTHLIEAVLASDLSPFAGETIHKLTPVVGQNLLDIHRGHLLQAAQKVAAASLTLIAVGAQIDPASSAVNGDKQIAPARLVWHLRQIFDVNVHKAGRMVFEGFLRASSPSTLGCKALRFDTPWRRKQRSSPAREAFGLMYPWVIAKRSSNESKKVRRNATSSASSIGSKVVFSTCGQCERS